ncbi:MAG: peptidase M19, partial [Verrucomicrobia bacterium]|nr:peptidase M19 [Verrucomicrobiota bacterium]
MFIFDAHLDLSMNALEWNRDLTRGMGEIRAREAGRTDLRDRGNGTVCLPELRRGSVGLVVATQIARYVKPNNPLPGWHSPAQAWAQTQGQLAWYRAMEEQGEMVQVRTRSELARQLARWGRQADGSFAPPAEGARRPVGYVLSLEGADSMVTLRHVERAYAQGLRALGPAHYGPGTYAQGTDAAGGLGPAGRDLLREMERLGIILDATHLCDESFREALGAFSGRVWASHSNCRALVPHHRQFADEQIRELIARGAVIGGALDAWMLVPGWIKFQTRPEETGVGLRHLVDHVDHICQLAGNARHAGIGTDLDGGYGREQSPLDVDTIADLQKLPALFRARGYAEADIAAILHGN